MARKPSPRPPSEQRRPAASGPGSGAQPLQVSRFVREALEAFAAEDVADRVVRAAMAAAALDALPMTRRELEHFVDHALSHQIAASLGEDVVEPVRARLAPLMIVVGSLEGGQRTPSDRVPTKELGRVPFEHVLVVARGREVADELAQHVDPKKTTVIPLATLGDLVRDLRAYSSLPRMIVVDVRRAHALVECAKREPSLIERALVVLWAGARAHEAELRAIAPSATVLRCGPDVTYDDLAALAALGPEI